MVNAAMASEEFLKGQTIPDGATLFDIKNKKLEQIFHAISLAKKAGVSDEYISALQKFNSDLTSAINDPTSSKANELVKAAINNGMLTEEDLLKPEVVKNTLQQIKDNSSKMLELFPEITKAEKYISEKYGETLEPEIKSKLIYGNIQRKNWIKRKNEIESTMQSPEMKRIADEIDEEFNMVSSLTADELTILKHGQTASKASKTILDRQFKIDKKISILNNTIAILRENNSQNSGTKNESIEKRRASKIIALENQKKQLLDEKRSIVKISRKLSKAEKSIIDHDKEIKFTAMDFISLPIEDQHAIIEQYKNNQLDAQNSRVVKEILDRSKLSFEKDNKTSYEEAARDYSTLQNSLNSLEKDLIVYEKDPTRLRVEAHIAETKIKMQAFYDKINERINELEQLSDIELRSAYKNLQNTVNNIKLDENGAASTEEDRINQAVLNTLNNSKLEGSPLGKKLSNIQDIESKIEDVSEILSNSNFDDFSISFVDDLHTFLLDNNIDPQNEKEVERFLLSNNEENLLNFIVEYSTSNAEILNQPDFIPANMISQEVTPYSINGVYMTKSDILGLVDIMTYAVKQAYNNKLDIVPNTEGLATEEELFGENEVLVEDIETKFDNKITGNTEEVITEDNITTESTENTESEITQEEIAELEEEGAVFIDIDVTDRDDYF